MGAQKIQFPNNLADQRLVQRVYKHHYRGRSNRAIATALGLSHNTVAMWLWRKDTYYPWIDHVVVDRAMAHNREAFNSMTVWEKRELLKRYRRRLAVEPYDTVASRGHRHAEYEHWTHVAADMLGTDVATLRQTITRQRQRRQARTA